MLAKVFSAAASGVEACPIEVEVDVAKGMVKEMLVGLPDAAVKESLHRIRAAMTNMGYFYPFNKRITINLAPADMRKEGPLYDLPMSLGLLVASEQLPAGSLGDYIIAGELALDGRIRPIRGALLFALLARQRGQRAILVPAENAEEAGVVEGVEVYGPENLGQAVGHLSGQATLPAVRSDVRQIFEREGNRYHLDLAEVKGQEHVKRALVVAAAGGHNLLMVGPPGSGKSMIAKRIPTILPPLTLEEAIETTKVWSVAGKLRPHQALVCERPFRSPHHTTSYPGLVGGGVDPTPGEISMAHNGVLFLDELPEFDRKSIESLRQPLEDRVITIARVHGSARFPANLMLVAAMNPCPCGHHGDPKKDCRCTPIQIQRYFGRVSGPMLDRIDLQVEVPHVSYDELTARTGSQESAQLREAVMRARQIQGERFASTPTHVNAAMTDAQLREFCAPDAEAEALLRNAVDTLGYSARTYSRILKVARTIADLEAQDKISSAHISEALQYRTLDREPQGSPFG